MLLVEIAVFGEVVDEMDLSVHRLEAVMADSIGNCQVLRLQCEVIPADLRESSVGDRYEWRLAFDEEEGQCLVGKDHNVGPFGERVVLHAGFHGEQRFGITVMGNEQVDEMLPDPFLGRQRDEFPADNVENMRFPVYLFNFMGKSGKVQRFHERR